MRPLTSAADAAAATMLNVTTSIAMNIHRKRMPLSSKLRAGKAHCHILNARSQSVLCAWATHRIAR
jgi:hypothetical protein